MHWLWPCPLSPLLLLWCLVNVDRECSITLTYLCPDSCFNKSLPLPHASAFHSPCSSALAFCCEVVYVHSDSRVVWASTSFLSVSIAWLPKGCYGIACGLSISLGCVLQHADCVLSHRVTWGHLDAPGPHRKLALSLSSTGPFKSMSMRNGSSLPRFHIWWLMNLQNHCCLVPYFSFIINLLLSYEKIRLGFFF